MYAMITFSRSGDSSILQPYNMANINLDNPKGTLEKRDLFVLSV